MALIDYKSSLSNYRKIVKPPVIDETQQTSVIFGEFKPISSNIHNNTGETYTFNTKKIESFERQDIRKNTNKNIDVTAQAPDVTVNKISYSDSNLLNLQRPNITKQSRQLNNETSFIDPLDIVKHPNLETQAEDVNKNIKTIDIVSKQSLFANDNPNVYQYNMLKNIDVPLQYQMQRVTRYDKNNSLLYITICSINISIVSPIFIVISLPTLYNFV